jgi:hypothetical protein
MLAVFGKNSGDGFVGPQFGNFPVTEEVGVMRAGNKDGKGEAGECRQLEMRLEAGATIPRAAIKPAFEKVRLRKGHVLGLHGKDSEVPETHELRVHYHRSFGVDHLENDLRKATKERDGDANTKRDFDSFRINCRGGRNLSGHGLKEGKRGIKRALTSADCNLTQCGGWAVQIQITRNQKAQRYYSDIKYDNANKRYVRYEKKWGREGRSSGQTLCGVGGDETNLGIRHDLDKPSLEGQIEGAESRCLCGVSLVGRPGDANDGGNVERVDVGHANKTPACDGVPGFVGVIRGHELDGGNDREHAPADPGAAGVNVRGMYDRC